MEYINDIFAVSLGVSVIFVILLVVANRNSESKLIITYIGLTAISFLIICFVLLRESSIRGEMSKAYQDKWAFSECSCKKE